MEALDGFPVTVEIPVAWGDMDAFNHVNNTMYFRYFETARIKFFEKIGIMQHMNDMGVGPILAQTDCKFKLPLSYPDTVTVGTRVIEILDDRFLMEYRVCSAAHQRAAARGTGMIVMFDYKHNRKAQIPDVIRKAIEQVEG